MSDADAPRPAATVVVLRETNHGPEVLLLRRKSALAFYGGAWVFPGGAIDDADHADTREPAQAARNAAVRELQEEAGLAIAPEALLGFSRWITPPGRTRRFDAWFFAALAPSASHDIALDAGELDAYRWITARAALDARERRELELPPPTFVTLTQLAAHASAAHALEALRAGGMRFYAPHPCVQAETSLIYLYEGDAGYHSRDPDAPGARHRLIVSGDDWRYDDSALKP
jgi:8-oxo-dGTP pyrophosphatase MutT (NUDIX family)